VFLHTEKVVRHPPYDQVNLLEIMLSLAHAPRCTDLWFTSDSKRSARLAAGAPPLADCPPAYAYEFEHAKSCSGVRTIGADRVQGVRLDCGVNSCSKCGG
jgi:hypothetical protein